MKVDLNETALLTKPRRTRQKTLPYVPVIRPWVILNSGGLFVEVVDNELCFILMSVLKKLTARLLKIF
jgi:hypothetical protein